MKFTREQQVVFADIRVSRVYMFISYMVEPEERAKKREVNCLLKENSNGDFGQTRSWELWPANGRHVLIETTDEI